MATPLGAWRRIQRGLAHSVQATILTVEGSTWLEFQCGKMRLETDVQDVRGITRCRVCEAYLRNQQRQLQAGA